MSKWSEELDRVKIAAHNYERSSTNVEQALYDYNGCYSKDYDIADGVNVNFKVIAYC